MKRKKTLTSMTIEREGTVEATGPGVINLREEDGGIEVKSYPQSVKEKEPEEDGIEKENIQILTCPVKINRLNIQNLRMIDSMTKIQGIQGVDNNLNLHWFKPPIQNHLYSTTRQLL
uniref:Uncharacterized protein n=1 Tax=Cacopsylla melanoneura TaxID=428564 RepID=A0A8D8SWX1_9HEMI